MQLGFVKVFHDLLLSLPPTLTALTYSEPRILHSDNINQSSLIRIPQCLQVLASSKHGFERHIETILTSDEERQSIRFVQRLSFGRVSRRTVE